MEKTSGAAEKILREARSDRLPSQPSPVRAVNVVLLSGGGDRIGYAGTALTHGVVVVAIRGKELALALVQQAETESCSQASER